MYCPTLKWVGCWWGVVDYCIYIVPGYSVYNPSNSCKFHSLMIMIYSMPSVQCVVYLNKTKCPFDITILVKMMYVACRCFITSYKNETNNTNTKHGYTKQHKNDNVLYPSTLKILTHLLLRPEFMMTSSNGNIFRVTDPLCGEFTGPRWIPHTKASDAELWCFLWFASE